MTTCDYNQFISEILKRRIKQKRLVDNSSIYNLVKKSDLRTKFETLVTKAELIAEQDKIIRFQVFDSSYFCGKSHFEDDATQSI